LTEEHELDRLVLTKLSVDELHIAAKRTPILHLFSSWICGSHKLLFNGSACTILLTSTATNRTNKEDVDNIALLNSTERTDNCVENTR
jgi:hypothetical protein